ncbi:SDR family NAD(P)-dependent oxidoreductase [Nocardia sp. NPDC050193]
MRELRDRVAVVAGGANGIGKGLATRFLTEGQRVFVAANDRGDLDRAAAEPAEVGEVPTVPADGASSHIGAGPYRCGGQPAAAKAQTLS